MITKAVQQIMLGSVTGTKEAARNTLQAIKEAGYDGVELNGFMIRPSSMMVRLLTRAAGMPTGKGGRLDWKSLCAEAGLKIVAVHEDLGGIEQDPEAIIREATEFGTKYVVITGMYRFDYSDDAAVADLVNRLNAAGERLKDGGIQLLYHNHNCEWRRLSSGKRAYDFLIEETDPEFVNFEFDSYWPTEAGADALGVMKKLDTRLKLYHINDRGSRVEGASMTPILKSDSMELGYGNMPLSEFMEQALSAGADAVILESHKNWADKSPVTSLQRSAEFLAKY